MNEIHFLVEEAPEGGIPRGPWGTRFLPRPVLERIEGGRPDAYDYHFDAAERPELVRLYMVRQEVLAPRDFREI